MKKGILICILVLIGQFCFAQKVEDIYFNLYTDSLKKGFYNYINVDAKLADGTWSPLDSTQIVFSANTGRFKGNDLFIDSAYTGDKVIVKAILKSNPSLSKDIVIYIRKRPFTEPLKSSEEVLEELRSRSKKDKK